MKPHPPTSILILLLLLTHQYCHGLYSDQDQEAASLLLKKSLIKARMKINRHAIQRRQALYQHFVELENSIYNEDDADPSDSKEPDVDQDILRLESRSIHNISKKSTSNDGTNLPQKLKPLGNIHSLKSTDVNSRLKAVEKARSTPSITRKPTEVNSHQKVVEKARSSHNSSLKSTDYRLLNVVETLRNIQDKSLKSTLNNDSNSRQKVETVRSILKNSTATKEPSLLDKLKSNTASIRTNLPGIDNPISIEKLQSNSSLRTEIGAINGPVFGDEIIHQTSLVHTPCRPQPSCQLMLIPNTVPSHEDEEKYLLSQAHALKQNAKLMSMQGNLLEHEVMSIKGGSGQHAMSIEGGHPLQGLHAHNMRLHNDYLNVDKPVHLPSGHHGHGPEHGGTEDLIHNAEHYKEGDSHDGGGSHKVESGFKIQSIGTGYPEYNLPTKPSGGGGGAGSIEGASSYGGLYEFVRPLPPATGPNPYEVLTSATLGQDYPGVSQEQSAAAMGFNNGGGAVTGVAKPIKYVVSLKGLKIKEKPAQKLINLTVKRNGVRKTRLGAKRKMKHRKRHNRRRKVNTRRTRKKG